MGLPKRGLPLRLIWFASLWLAGVTAIAAVSLVIKWVLAI
jgi:hypothetical protein